MAKAAPKLVTFKKFFDDRGSLSVIEALRDVPFPIKRVFYFYDIPAGANRGSHAHKVQHQCIVCLSGGFDVLLDDGRRKRTVHLKRPWQGLHIPPMVWASQVRFYSGTVGLVVASDHFDESDYIRDYGEFLRAVRKGMA